MTDPKQGEREYYRKIGPEGLRHALDKPFSDEACARHLANLTALFSLLAPPPGRVIEFGCGAGWLCFFLARRGYDTTGVDIAEDAIRAAEQVRRERGLEHLRFLASDYEHFRCAEPADYVIFYDALHHAEAEDAALRAAYAALKPGGVCLAFEPGRRHSCSPGSREAVARFGVHEKDMPPRKIAALGRAAGFRRHLILPRPHELNRALYDAAHYPADASSRALGWRRWLRQWRALRRLRISQNHGPVLLFK